MNVIEANALGYSLRPDFWKPRRTILHDVTFGVARGEIFGFLGPNGAGKTTTLKALLGLLRPERGSVRILGEPPTNLAVRRRVGFMPERAYFPEHLTGRELVIEHGLLAGLNLDPARRRAMELLEQVGLKDAAGERLRGYSKGMLQRVGLAQALVGDPELVVLDEPMSGLDPIGRRDVRELMLALGRAGKTVLFSTHILPDVEAICDRVAILTAGRTRKVGTLDELLAHVQTSIEVVAETCPPKAEEAARALGYNGEPRARQRVFRSPSLEAANRLIDALRAHGAVIGHVQTHQGSLEDVFVSEAASWGKEGST